MGGGENIQLLGRIRDPAIRQRIKEALAEE